MGVCMFLQALSDEKIEELSRDSDELQNVVSGSTFDPGMDDIMAGLIQKDPRLTPLAGLFTSQAPSEDMSPQFDLEKCWHGLHYLLTGSASQGEEPLCYLVYKGWVIGVCHGGDVRAISSSQLAAFESALQSIDKEEILRRYDGKAMAAAEIYPSELWARDDEDGREYVCEYLEKLKEFLKGAKERNEGAIVWVG
jgi:Domain of unknown function (DUF1877)